MAVSHLGSKAAHISESFQLTYSFCWFLLANCKLLNRRCRNSYVNYGISSTAFILLWMNCFPQNVNSWAFVTYHFFQIWPFYLSCFIPLQIWARMKAETAGRSECHELCPCHIVHYTGLLATQQCKFFKRICPTRPNWWEICNISKRMREDFV